MSKTITQPISFQIDNDKQAVIVVINTDSKVVTFPISFEEMNSISEEAKLVQERINGKKAKSAIDVLNHVKPEKVEIPADEKVTISGKLYYGFIHQNAEMRKLKAANELLLRERNNKQKKGKFSFINWLRHLHG